MATHRIDRRWAAGKLPQRPQKSHKGTFGHVLVCAGSPGTWGAGVLASSSAYRAGSGYVTWASFQRPDKQIKQIPEVLIAKLPEALKNKRVNAFVVGPGLGVDNKTKKLLLILKKQKAKSVILDADALNVLAKSKMGLLPSEWILTPHSGELSRLLGLSVKVIEADRKKAVLMAAEKFGCAVLLKGSGTLVAKDKKIFVIQSGNSALAKAGTGDVLSGMIGAFLAQGLDSLDAAVLGAYLHGWLADEWIKKHDPISLKAMDLVEALPTALYRLRRSKR